MEGLVRHRAFAALPFQRWYPQQPQSLPVPLPGRQLPHPAPIFPLPPPVVLPRPLLLYTHLVFARAPPGWGAVEPVRPGKGYRIPFLILPFRVEYLPGGAAVQQGAAPVHLKRGCQTQYQYPVFPLQPAILPEPGTDRMTEAPVRPGKGYRTQYPALFPQAEDPPARGVGQRPVVPVNRRMRECRTPLFSYRNPVFFLIYRVHLRVLWLP